MALGACQYSPDTAQRTISYNVGIAQSTNNMFLLNALRSAERQPTYYTRNQSNTTSSTFNPSITSMIPNGRSFATTTADQESSGLAMPTGFPSVKTATVLATAAAITVAPTLSMTETNQLSLTNLDDQQSMQGLMTPVSMQQIKNYVANRFSPEELLLLYVDHISMPRGVWDNLLNAAQEHCVQIATIQNLYCAYVLTELSRDPNAPESKVQHLNPACFDRSGGLKSEPIKHPNGENELVTFVNDPAVAWQPADTSLQQVRSFACLHQVLRVLLALELDFADDPPKAQYRLSIDMIKNNPRYLSDLAQQKLIFAEPFKQELSGKRQLSSNTSPTGHDSTQFGVCKPSDDMHFALTDDSYVQGLFAEALLTDRQILVHNPTFRSKDTKPDSSDCATAVTNWESGVKTPDPLIKITPRSLEAMVYFLGEIIRHDHFAPPSKDERATVLAWSAPDQGYLYEQTLFDVEKGLPPRDAIAFAVDTTGLYYVPSPCGGRRANYAGCTMEYPGHTSGQVLTMVNQLWGLNKTVATAPVIPTVVVSH
jgi:hypothetical protein